MLVLVPWFVFRGMASADVCCMVDVWEKLMYAVSYISENRRRQQLYGRHTSAYISFFDVLMYALMYEMT